MLFTESQRGKLLEALEALALASSLLAEVELEGRSQFPFVNDTLFRAGDAVGEAGEFVSTLLDPETEAELRGEL
jgi:hypothetical protein